jgi:hypothetical protein
VAYNPPVLYLLPPSCSVTIGFCHALCFCSSEQFSTISLFTNSNSIKHMWLLRLQNEFLFYGNTCPPYGTAVFYIMISNFKLVFKPIVLLHEPRIMWYLKCNLVFKPKFRPLYRRTRIVFRLLCWLYRRFWFLLCDNGGMTVKEVRYIGRLTLTYHLR